MANWSKMVGLLTAGAFLVLVILSNGPQVVEASFMDKIGSVFNVFNKVICPAKHTGKVNICHTLAFPFYNLQVFFQNDPLKAKCCSRLAAKDCQNVVFKFYCGKTTSEFFTFSNQILDSIATGSQCIDYTSIFQCTHWTLLAVEFGIIVLVIWLVLKGILLCLCGLFNRG